MSELADLEQNMFQSDAEIQSGFYCDGGGGVTSLSEPHRPGDKVLIPEVIIFDSKLHCHPHYVGSEEVY